MNIYVRAIVLAALYVIPHSAVSQSSLPVEVQADLLQQRIVEALESGDSSSVFSGMDAFRELAVAIPPSLFYVEARAAYLQGDFQRSMKAMNTYLRDSDSTDSFYQQAIRFYPELNETVVAAGLNPDIEPYIDLGSGGTNGIWSEFRGDGTIVLRKEGRLLHGELFSETRTGNFDFEMMDEQTYEGTLTSNWVCPFLKFSTGTMDQVTCQTDRRVELTSVEPNRIEGRVLFSTYPKTPVFGNQGRYCKACGMKAKMKWHDFVWIRQE